MYKIKKCVIIGSIMLLFILILNNANATYFNVSSPKNIEEKSTNSDKKIVNKVILKTPQIDNTTITIGDIFESYVSYYEGKIPNSYKYINVNITGVLKNSKNYEILQKLIYVNLLPNDKAKINFDSQISAYTLYKLSEKLFKVNLVSSNNNNYLKSRKANKKDLIYLKKILNKTKQSEEFKIKSIKIGTNSNLEEYKQKQQIFNDVYKTIKNKHYNKKTILDLDLIDGAIKGLAEGTGDRFTNYFPAIENNLFQESLNGHFEGIGSYVEMEKPGILKIISPIPGSPSEKAGLKGGDIILKADGKEILKTTSLREAISWIKGPKGTIVTLTINRGGKELEIKVKRGLIVIKDIEYKKLDNKTFYIKLLIFGNNVSGDFNEALNALKKEKGIKKVIFDLRNNGGGYLDEVSDILGYFIAKGENTAVVKYLSGDQKYYSKGYELIDFSKYKIVILQNGGSASASEIFVGTVKDYFPKAVIIGEQSYGKGSVQTIKSYKDGSSFKYTVAKWYTGKTQTGIDGVGIPVDIELEFDFERFKKTKIDNQLEKAKSLR